MHVPYLACHSNPFYGVENLEKDFENCFFFLLRSQITFIYSKANELKRTKLLGRLKVFSQSVENI